MTLLLLCIIPAHAADYREIVGFRRLEQTLGPLLPDGNGVRLAQVEAPLDSNTGFWRLASAGTWWPDTDDSELRGKHFDFVTARGQGSHSDHATGVGRLFYGRDTSMAPAASHIDLFSTTDWTASTLHNGVLLFPGTMNAQVINHSWAGSTGSREYDSELLRRLDWSVNADRNIHVVGISNGAQSPPLLGNAFNIISVGRSDGQHGTGTSEVDSVYREGRVMPLIVAPMDTSSFATPVVAAAAALLVETARRWPGFSRGSLRTLDGRVIRAGERPETIKTVLMAGANRHYAIGAGGDSGYRARLEQRSDNGLDRRYGAGQLNILNSYAILSGGEQHSTEDDRGGKGAIRPYGYDYDSDFGGADGGNEVANYHFTADERRRWLTVTLAWNVMIETGGTAAFDTRAVLYDLDLELYDDTAATRVALSSSWSQNTETLWQPLIAGHEYRIVVKASERETPFAWRYALAWRIDAGEMSLE